MTKRLTLCLAHEPGRVLLGLKKRGFGAGRWNGFGGKLEADETIEQAARREMHEECGVTVRSMEHVGILLFRGQDKDDFEVHVFRVDAFDGVPTESEEMRPQWFDEDKLPFDQMWPDDMFWFPMFLSGKKFRGSFTFEGQELVDHELDETESEEGI